MMENEGQQLPEKFGVEFEGTLIWEGDGFGHFKVFGGKATVLRIVALHVIPQSVAGRDGDTRCGIRERISRSRLSNRP